MTRPLRRRRRFAVGRHIGSLDNLSQTVWSLFRDWLPGSGETLRDAPVFFHYLNFVNDVPERTANGYLFATGVTAPCRSIPPPPQNCLSPVTQRDR